MAQFPSLIVLSLPGLEPREVKAKRRRWSLDAFTKHKIAILSGKLYLEDSFATKYFALHLSVLV